MTNPEEAPKAGEQPLEVAAAPPANDDAADEEGEAPTLVEAKPEDDGAAQKDLDDESPKTFPQVLMDILNDEEDNDTISWMSHGRSFIIYKKKKFANKVLPKFFKATKFTSFTRKLNRWGFTRVTRGPEMGSYFHKLFLRDDPSLCLRMSSHSSSKFQEVSHHLMPAPMMPFAMPMPFMGMMPPPGTDINQQNQFINQQLQHLQWQQFQLQQFQQQQQHQQQQHHSPVAPAAPAYHHYPPAPPTHHGAPPPPNGGHPPMHQGSPPPPHHSQHPPHPHGGMPPSHPAPPPGDGQGPPPGQQQQHHGGMESARK